MRVRSLGRLLLAGIVVLGLLAPARVLAQSEWATAENDMCNSAVRTGDYSAQSSICQTAAESLLTDAARTDSSEQADSLRVAAALCLEHSAIGAMKTGDSARAKKQIQAALDIMQEHRDTQEHWNMYWAMLEVRHKINGDFGH